jgi:hypothetical protein
MALKGATDDAVKFAATHMRNQQFIILKAAFIAISALFLGACILSWANYDIGIAVVTTVVYISGYYYLISHCYAAYRTFVPSDENAFLEPVLDANGAPIENAYRLVSSNGTGEEKLGEDGKPIVSSSAASLAAAQEATKLKVKAYIWKRQSIEDGGLFIKYFGVLDKGRLDLYKSERDYRENANPINSKPIKLWQYDLELDHR